VGGGSYPGLAPGALLLEGVGVFAATVTLCRRQPSLARRVLAMSVVGAAGAAGLAMYRLAEIGLRNSAFLHTILLQPRNIRISLPFADVNAAGSYLAMMVFAAGALAVAGRGRRWTWGAVAALISAALWLTGSRTAWAAIVLSGTFAVAWILPRSKRGRLMATVLAAIALVFVVVSSILPSGRGTPGEEMSRGVVVRMALGRAALEMTRTHPILGVGIGRFMQESAKYLDPAFAQEYYPRENAHNNFLQILAELGCVGLAAFLWFLAAVGRHINRSGRLREDLLLAGTASGILAFLISCLAGHPLLVPEIALAFSLVFGAAAGLASERDAGMPGSAVVAPGATPPRKRTVRGRWLLAAVVVCLAVSVPVRAHRLLETETDLREASVGFSDWATDSGGVKYRSMTGKAQFYVPDSTCWLRFGIRLAPDDPRSSTDVELRVDGNVADRQHASRHEWTELKVVFYPRSKPGFRRIELRTTAASGTRLLVGAPALSDCR
jgi:O-antigen ligase